MNGRLFAAMTAGLLLVLTIGTPSISPQPSDGEGFPSLLQDAYKKDQIERIKLVQRVAEMVEQDEDDSAIAAFVTPELKSVYNEAFSGFTERISTALAIETKADRLKALEDLLGDLK